MKNSSINKIIITITLTTIITAGIIAAAGCRGATEIPPGLILPAFRINVHFPENSLNSGTLRADPGTTITLPVTIEPAVKTPISIRLVQGENTPDFIKFQGNDEFITIQPWETPTVNIICTVDDNATTGSYQAQIHGELKDPISGWGEGDAFFQVFITNKF